MVLKLKRYLPILFSPLVFSCFQEDQAVAPWPGEVFTIPDNIEEYFSYFDLQTGLVVTAFPVNSWQIAFECGDTCWHIQINSGAGWFLWNSNQTDIEAVIQPPPGVLWSYDKQSAYPDSTAAGNWVDTSGDVNHYTNSVYFLGNYLSGKYYDVHRLKFFAVDDNKYQLLVRNEDSGITDSVTIFKSDTSNFVYYNLFSRRQVNLEPRKEDFDLIFGPYYDLATQLGVTIPYLVRGTFLNAWATFAALDSVNDYDQISYEMINEIWFSNQKDIIGYQWKDISIDPTSGAAEYKVNPGYTYIIHTASDKYYKMKFLSFSVDGVSGYPRFEYKELKPLQ
jgi:hypothetical protein